MKIRVYVTAGLMEDLSDINRYSSQLAVIITGFIMVMIGVGWYVNIITQGMLEPFGPKVIVFIGLFIFLTSSLWLVLSINRYSKKGF